MLTRRPSLTALLLLVASPVLAAPAVTDVGGALEAASTLQVTGSGFGAKSPAAPILWETFDAGVAGEPLATDPDWPSYNSPGALYSNVSPHSGGLCVYNWAEYGNASDDEFATNNYFFPETSELYYSYLYRHDGTDVGPAVQKLGRINTPGNLYSGPGMLALSDSYVFYRPDDVSIYPSDDNGTGRYFSTTVLGSSTWTRQQLYGRLSEPAGATNGLLLVSVGGEEKTFANIVTRAVGYDFAYSSVILGLMFANIDDVPDAWHDMYIDDVYIDRTRARVEVCTGATWTTRGFCNPQPPTAWSDSSIEVSTNVGDWSAGQAVYLYVLDASGVPNANGYPLDVGGTSSHPRPNAPTALRLL